MARLRALFPAFDQLNGGAATRWQAAARIQKQWVGYRGSPQLDQHQLQDVLDADRASPPAPLQAGQQLRQRLGVTPLDVPFAAIEPGPVRLSGGAPTGTRVPPIGLGADQDGYVPPRIVR